MQASHTIHQWSSVPRKTVEGTPPGPNVRPDSIKSEERRANVKVVNPIYKFKENHISPKTNGDVKANSSYTTGTLSGAPDYKVEQSQEHYKLHVIDPKVQSHANMPVSTPSLPNARRRIASDFPSQHKHQSFLKLAPMEQRRLRSVETRPLTTSDYLTGCLERHREMEASKLREYLKAKEGDANQPWNKPGWPGCQQPKREDGLKELEQIRQSIEGLQKAVDRTPKKNEELEKLAQMREQLLERSKSNRAEFNGHATDIQKEGPAPVPGHVKDQIREMLESRVSNDTSSTSILAPQDRSGYVTDVSSATWQFSSQSFSPRSVVSINGGTKDDSWLLKVRTDLSPYRSASGRNANQQAPYMPAMLLPVDGNTMKREYNTKYKRTSERYGSLPALDNEDRYSTLIKIKDERSKPRSIMKTQEKRESEAETETHSYPVARRWQEQEIVKSTPNVSETVQKIEEVKRTEEIERRIHKKEKKSKHRRGHHSSSHRLQNGNQRQITDGYTNGNGYIPTNEGYFRQTTAKRIKDRSSNEEIPYRSTNGNLSHARYGSVSDSLRRGELKYIPNGEVRKRHSSRNGSFGRHKSQSGRDMQMRDFDERSYSSSRHDPLVEFPATLPRDELAPMPPPHRNGYLNKSRSYADWDDHRGWAGALKRYDDDMTRLESEFHDSLLMPIPQGNMNEKDYRTEKLPGGHESLSRDVKANSGRRMNASGMPTHFNESKQEFNYKRETELNNVRH